MAKKLVKIAEYDNSMDADFAKQLLADNEIEAITTGENVANVLPIPGVAKVTLFVAEPDANAAIEILKTGSNAED